MTIEEILAGESKNVEFKVQRPDKSIKYMKNVVAFANGKGGRIVFGIDDKTLEIVGMDEDNIFKTISSIKKKNGIRIILSDSKFSELKIIADLPVVTFSITIDKVQSDLMQNGGPEVLSGENHESPESTLI